MSGASPAWGQAVALTALLLAAGAAGAPARAQPAGEPQAATTLHIEERAERAMPRDRLRAALRVDAADADPAKLQGEINRRMAAALRRAHATEGLVVTTGSYVVDQERPDPKAAPRWHGAQSLSLLGRDAAAVLATVGALQQDGLLVAALSYELSPEAAKAVEDDLTATALARLQERAARIATTLGLAVERLVELRVGNANGTQPIPRAMMSAAKSDSAAPVAEPGEATVSVTVEADVALTPRR